MGLLTISCFVDSSSTTANCALLFGGRFVCVFACPSRMVKVNGRGLCLTDALD